MERRRFVTGCAAVATVAGLSASARAWAAATPHFYSRARLVDIHGDPLKARQLASRTNYVFSYPFAATPCFLLDLGRPVAAAASLLRADGATYAWSGGVGARHSVVAFSAICAHKLAILLDYDAERDELSALGTVGAEQFDAFFRKYDFKLALDYGAGKARVPVGATTVVRELKEYCRQTIQC
jgi:Rieske Fe-S protein